MSTDLTFFDPVSLLSSRASDYLWQNCERQTLLWFCCCWMVWIDLLLKYINITSMLFLSLKKHRDYWCLYKLPLLSPFSSLLILFPLSLFSDHNEKEGMWDIETGVEHCCLPTTHWKRFLKDIWPFWKKTHKNTREHLPTLKSTVIGIRPIKIDGAGLGIVRAERQREIYAGCSDGVGTACSAPNL